VSKLQSSEILYRAFRQLDDDGSVSPADIRFPDISVNRATLSKPEDLLIGREDAGVFSFPVSGIPGPYLDGSLKFFAEADPVVGNSAHAEVRAYVGGVYQRGYQPSKAVRLQFRIELAKATTVVIKPTFST